MKYKYTVSFDEKLAVWNNVDAVIISDKPLTEDELNTKIANGDYDEISSNLDWTDGATRIEVSPVYDYEKEEVKDEDTSHKRDC